MHNHSHPHFNKSGPTNQFATALLKRLISRGDVLDKEGPIIGKSDTESDAKVGRGTLTYSGVPLASTMTTTEIADAIAQGSDPWSIDLHGSVRPSPSDLPIPLLLTAIEFLSVFGAPDVIAELFTPGAITALVVPDPQHLTRVVDTFRGLVDTLRLFPQVEGSAIGKIRLIYSQPTSGSYSSKSAEDICSSFAKEVDAVIAAGDSAILICDSLESISDARRAVLTASHCWPELTDLLLLDLLAQTHSSTGQIAHNAIAAILPHNADLRAIPLPLICHAFRASSTLAAARRLSKYGSQETAKPIRLLLDDVKGVPDVCAKLREIIVDLNDWKSGKVAWRDVSASALLYGPPGSGKTMAAEAVAGSADIQFIATSYTDLQSAGHLGDYLKAMKLIVAEAIANAPCVFFLDELDSFGSRNSGAGSKMSRYMTAVINDLLQQLTRLNAAEGVIVMAATNFIQDIDPAILRSGRFDTKIAVPHPDKSGVREILLHHIGSDIQVAQNTMNRLLNQSGADLANLARDAKRRARQGRQALTTAHLAAAVEEAVPEISDEKLYRVAAHEAGHLVVAAMLDLPMPIRAQVSHSGGEIIRPAPSYYSQESIRNELAYLMGGRAAEKLLVGNISSGSGGGIGSDLDQATDIAIAQDQQWGLGQSDGLFYAPVDLTQRHALSESRRQVINVRLKKAETLAVKTLEQNREILAAVADALLEERELNRHQIAMLFAANPLMQHPSLMETTTLVASPFDGSTGSSLR